MNESGKNKVREARKELGGMKRKGKGSVDGEGVRVELRHTINLQLPSFVHIARSSKRLRGWSCTARPTGESGERHLL